MQIIRININYKNANLIHIVATKTNRRLAMHYRIYQFAKYKYYTEINMVLSEIHGNEYYLRSSYENSLCGRNWH